MVTSWWVAAGSLSRSDKQLFVFADTFRSASRPATKESIHSHGESGNNSRQLTHRRDYRMLHDLAGLFHAVKGTADHFVGANYLQPGAVNHVAHRGVHTFDLRAN